jgi:hypothetical protein
MEIFGYQLRKLSDEKNKGITFVAPSKEDGAIEVDVNDTYLGGNYAGNHNYAINLDSIPTDEIKLIHQYRNMALNQDIDEAIQEIVNEAIITEDLKATVDIVLDDADISEAIKEKIVEEFEGVLKLLKFKNDGYGIFRKWYIDGKLIYHKVINKNKTTAGIVQLVPIDPLHIRLIREVKKINSSLEFDLYKLEDVNEYFIYSKSQIKSDSMKLDKNTAIKIPTEAIAYITSGLMSSDGKVVLSQLYKSIKAYNNLKMMEDAVVIYRVSRAPERRVFYVDVGALPSGKAEQYLKSVMDKFKSKVTYDINTGSVTNRKNFQSMLEDYWLPRREGGKGTEVTTLPSGQNLGELADVEYSKTKLYKSLNVPVSRFQTDSVGFNIGRTTEITRDEIRFHKFISRQRNKFSELFDDILKTQLILKRIITKQEWDELLPDISYSFIEDNYFSELKQIELMQDRLNDLDAMKRNGIIGVYISHDTVRREVLRQTEQQIKDEDKKILEEQDNEIYNPKEQEDDNF